jgi:peptidoglycan/xylan/chitin deacetylase (PgdA/CDA1 family)
MQPEDHERGARAGLRLPKARQRVRELRRRGALVAVVLAAAAGLAAVLLVACGGHARRRPTPAAAAAVAGDHATVPGARSGAAGEPAGESQQARALIALGKPIYCGARRGNEVALTFDDGPGPYTRLVLAKLRKHGIRATFFDVARNIPLLPGATRQEAAIGGVGDHTVDHPLLTALAPAQAEAQIARAQAALERSSGAPVFLFRPPYGGRSQSIDAIARAHGLLEILWTVDSADSLGANYAQIERNVIAGLQGGSIILMHENHGQTVRALLGIFAALDQRRLRAVSVPQLLADDPPSIAQVRAGGLGCGVRAGTRTAG